MKKFSGMTTTVPATAEEILFTLYSTVRQQMESNGWSKGWIEAAIPAIGGEIVAHITIDEEANEVIYRVEANPVAGFDYPAYDFASAKRVLRNLLTSEVVF